MRFKSAAPLILALPFFLLSNCAFFDSQDTFSDRQGQTYTTNTGKKKSFSSYAKYEISRGYIDSSAQTQSIETRVDEDNITKKDSSCQNLPWVNVIAKVEIERRI